MTIETYTSLFTVTEKEIELGVLSSKDCTNSCLWFNRTISDIDQQEDGEELSAFKGSYSTTTIIHIYLR